MLAERSLTYYNTPGVVRCDSYNPCRNVTFDNVNVYQRSKTSRSAYTALETQVFARFLAGTEMTDR